MYIKSVSIRDLRTFKSAKLDFLYPGRSDDENSSTPELPNVNLLLGNNGQGKSTTLRAIALSVLSPILRDSGYVPYSMVRREPGARTAKEKLNPEAVLEAEIVLSPQDVHSTENPGDLSERRTRVTIERIKGFERVGVDTDQTESDSVWESMYDENSPAFLMVGYGATRRVEDPEHYDSASRKRTMLRYGRVAGLFQESTSMVPLERWLPDLLSSNKGRHTQVVNLIDKLLDRPFSFDGHYEDQVYYFRQGKSLVPFGAMSDGYRAYIGWITDLLYHICMGCPSGAKLVENRGIVLVDEVDLHLHPDWQRTVVPVLARAFPNLQFVLTTHSPIITGSLRSENIWVMKAGKRGSRAVRLETGVHGLNADQILISDYFGLDSSRAPGIQKRLKALNLRALQGDDNAALEVLQTLASGLEDDSPDRAGPKKKGGSRRQS